MNKFNHCHFPNMSIGAIPTSYLDSLTYLEQILCINNKLCEIISYLDTISLEEIENLINEKINEIQEYVDNQDEMIYNNLKDYVDTNLNLQVNLLKTLISEKVIFLLDYIKDNNIVLKNQIEEELNELKNQINQIIIKGIDVYDPTTGQVNNIQDVVYNLYKYLRYYGITANEFDTIALSCEQFDNKGLTARIFDLYSKCKLTIDFYHNMYSPITGEITPISTVINQLASLHKKEITALEFDNLELTALGFDEKDLTAYQFDWEGKTLLS